MIRMAKFLKCPNCSFVFRAPMMDKKILGFGFSPPGWGVVECPNCKQDKARQFYIVVLEEEFKTQEESGKLWTQK